jgi:glycerophosphoryl diester phosphodiesterase
LAVDQALVERAHAAGLAVNVWTCDDPEAMVRLAGWGGRDLHQRPGRGDAVRS